MDINAAAAYPPAVEQGYRVARLLGSGGRSRVWLAVRNDDGACFALKIPVGERAGFGSSFETRHELNILARLDHENLLQLHTVLDTDQGPGLLMEYAPGASLARLATVRGTLPPGEAVTVLAGIAAALAYLHDQGFTHGEVSPGKILFTARGKPLLADLGLARLAGPGDLGLARLAGPGDGEAAGAAEFADPAAGAVPEQQFSPAADVYALAAVGWFALTGQLPPAAEHRTAAAARAGIPPALFAALDAGLQADPQHRPDAADFGAAVLAGAAFQPLDLVLPAADPPADIQRRTLHGRRRRRGDGRERETGTRQRGGRRREGSARSRRADELGLDPLSPVRYGWLRRRFPRGGISPTRGAVGGRPGGPVLAAAALLVAATLGLGAVAVAAPELLTPARDAAARHDPEPPVVTAPPEDAAAREAAPEASAAGEPPPAAVDGGAVDGGDRSGGLPAATGEELVRLQRSEDPVQAVPALAELRTRAFLAADAGQLDAVNVPGSPAMAADRAELAKLAAAGTVLSGLAVEVLSAGPAAPAGPGEPAQPAAPAAEPVRVPATVATSAYQERTADGGTVRTVAALPRQDLVLVLARGPEGWRITDVLAPP